MMRVNRSRGASARSVPGAVLGALLLVGGLPAAPAAAQDDAARWADRRPVVLEIPAPGLVQELRLKDESTLYGRVVEFDEASVVFIAVSGARLEVLRGHIVSLRIVRGRVTDHRFRRADPNPTRLFFAPTARPLAAGEAYLGVYEFMMPFVQVGLTSRLSVGGGTPLVFGGGGSRLFWFTPKLTLVDRGGRSAAVGLIQFAGSGLDDLPGIAYGVATFGDPDGAVTVSAGYAYAGESGTAVVMLAGERRVSRRMKAITENWLWQDGPQLLSGGMRFIGDRLSADLGLVFVLADGDVVGFPVVNFSYHF